MALFGSNINQRLIALLLSAIMLLGAVAAPASSMGCAAMVVPTAEHSLHEAKTDGVVYQYFDRCSTPTVEAEQQITPKSPLLPLALCCSAAQWGERIMAQQQRSYRVVEQAIRLSAPSWMLIFPFNAFW